MSLLLLFKGAGTTDPVGLSGCVGWWDANDASTFTLSGSNVTQWRDKSGHANHLGAAGDNPARTGISPTGRGVVEFDGTNYLALASQISTGGGITIGVTARIDSGNSATLLSGYNNELQVRTEGSPGIPKMEILHVNTSSDLRSSTSIDLGEWVTMVFTVSTTALKTYLNGTLDGSSTAGWSSFGNVSMVGARDGGHDEALDGAIGAMVVYDRVLSAGEVASLHNYLIQWNSPLQRTTIGSWSTSPGTSSWTTGSFTPANNSLLVAFVGADTTGSGDPGANLTITDTAGLTWTKRAGISSTTWIELGTAVWTAPVATGVSMTVTGDCGADDLGETNTTIVQYTGYDTTTPVGATGTMLLGWATGTETITLSARPLASSRVVGAAMVQPTDVAGVTLGTDYVEIAQNASMEVMERVYDVPSTSFTWDDISTTGATYQTTAVAIEVRAAQTGPVIVGKTHTTYSGPGAATIALPRGAAAGDLAILTVSGNDGDASLDAAFTQVGSKAVTDTTTESIVGKRTLTGADIIAGTLPVVGPPSFNITDYTLWVFQSAAGTPVVDASASYTSNDTGLVDPTIMTLPAATATGTNNTVIVATQSRNVVSAWTSPPSDVIVDHATAGIWNGHFNQAGSGSTGTRTVDTPDSWTRWTSWTIVVAHPSGGTSAPGTTATGSGTANNTLPNVSPVASVFAASSTAFDALPNVQSVSSLATATATANSSTPIVDPVAAASTGSGAAFTSLPAVKPLATAPSGTGSANNGVVTAATIGTAASGAGTGNTSGAALLVGGSTATASGTANNASVTTGVSVTATHATASGTADNATPRVAVTATNATTAGTANNAAVTGVITAVLASATGAAQAPTASIKPPTSLATASGTANTSGASLGDVTTNGTGSGTANTGTPRVSVTAVTATASGAALDATASIPGSTSAYAVTATATATANEPGKTVKPVGSNAAATGTAQGPAPAVRPLAVLANATGAASDPSKTATSVTSLASGSGTAFAPSPAISSRPTNPAATGTANSSTATVSVRSTNAAATGSTQTSSPSEIVTAALATAAATTMIARILLAVQAAHASATATAHQADVSKSGSRRVKIWDGSQWVTVPVKIYDPDTLQWVESPAVKFYDPFARQWKNFVS